MGGFISNNNEKRDKNIFPIDLERLTIDDLDPDVE
jgi:hypothetical protein